MKFIDTIIAQATPCGNGGIGIIRISGPQTINISYKLLHKITKPRYAVYIPFKNEKNKTIDHGIAIYYKKPYSYTGEDILELHSHGGQKIIELIIKVIIKLHLPNVRLAKPGEFTQRAFLNNKLDLIQAESIINIINSTSEQALLHAIQSLEGFLSKKISSLIKIIQDLLINTEKIITFNNTKNTFYKQYIFYFREKIKYIYNKINNIYKNIKNNLYNQNSIKILIIGKPNVGKSSLMNYLTKKKTSIITNIAGTTRDLIKEYININNINIKIYDTAGIHNTNNIIEQIGINKALKHIKSSQIILFIDVNPINWKKNIIKNYKKLINIKNKIVFLINNKIDLYQMPYKYYHKNNYYIFNISIQNKIGTKEFKKKLFYNIKKLNNIETNFNTNLRQKTIIKKTLINIYNITKIKKQNIIYNIDIIYHYLSKTLNKLNNLLGKNNNINDKTLNKIFKNFCIGK